MLIATQAFSKLRKLTEPQTGIRYCTTWSRDPEVAGSIQLKLVAQSSKRHLPTIEVMGSTPVSNMIDHAWEEFVNTLLKVVGFIQVLQFPPAEKVDRVGKD